MKRLTALLLAMILCFSLEACSMKTEPVPSSQETHTQATAQEATEDTPLHRKKPQTQWKNPLSRISSSSDRGI